MERAFAVETARSRSGLPEAEFVSYQGEFPIHTDPEILGGTTVFVGTRVPVRALIAYLEGGDSLDDFLSDFPSVTRQQAVAAIEQAADALGAGASSR